MNEEEQERWRITDEESLDWAINKLLDNQALIRDYEKRFEDFKAETKRLINEKKESIQYFKDLIAEYEATKREEDPKFKLQTPLLRATWSKGGTKLVPDKDKLIKQLEGTKWVTTKTEKKLNWKDYQNHLKDHITIHDGKVITDDGEVLDGLTVQIDKPELQIKTHNEKGNWSIVK